MERMFSNLARVARGFAFASVYGEPLNLPRRRRSDAIFDQYGREKMRSPNKLNLKSNFKFWHGSKKYTNDFENKGLLGIKKM